MLKAIGIYISTFFVIFLINQTFYGACFASYCLASGFPKVAIISAIVAFVIFKMSEQNKKSGD